jgi:hypothetical protein
MIFCIVSIQSQEKKKSFPAKPLRTTLHVLSREKEKNEMNQIIR